MLDPPRRPRRPRARRRPAAGRRAPPALTRRYGDGRGRRRRPARRLARRPRRPVHRRHGAVGLRQVHAHAPAGRARPPDRGHASASAARTSRRCATTQLTHAAPRAHRLRLPGVQPAPDADGRGERPPAAARSPAAARARRAVARCSSASASATAATIARASSPAASSSASPSPGRSSPSRPCSSPTSRRATSTPRPAPRPRPPARGRRRRAARRPSWSRTTPAPPRGPTASSCLADGRIVDDLRDPTEAAVLDRDERGGGTMIRVALTRAGPAPAADVPHRARDRRSAWPWSAPRSPWATMLEAGSTPCRRTPTAARPRPSRAHRRSRRAATRSTKDAHVPASALDAVRAGARRASPPATIDPRGQAPGPRRRSRRPGSVLRRRARHRARPGASA